MCCRWLLSLSLLIAGLPAWAQPSPEAELTPPLSPTSSSTALADDTAPSETRRLSFAELGQGAVRLSGMNPARQLEFGVRGDRLVSDARLTLDYTPSPALLDDVSHIKVYLNDELMGTLPLAPRDGPALPGNRELSRTLALEPRLLGDYNRLRLELVGHYSALCEDPTHSSIWVEIAGDSTLVLTEQALPLTHSLSRLPRPFFDANLSAPLELPIVVPPSPDLEVQRAGGIVASWFGSLAGWRGQHFPVSVGTPPREHAVVLATNDRRPAFLADHPAVDGPTIEIIDHPETPYAKLLLIMGRDSGELVEAARGLALGSVLLRGQSARVERVDDLEPRRPYDAPAWVRTDRPVSFAELIDYPGQLQAQGNEPPPLSLEVRIPPDLFVWQDQHIDLQLAYRYTPPVVQGGSRLDVNINGQFLEAFPLDAGGNGESGRLQVPIIEDWLSRLNRVAIPALKLGASNQLRFDFAYANRVGGASPDECRNVTTVPHQVAIDARSTIDFSGFPHYLEMPALRTFANAGFPFSRLADLSQTLVVMPRDPSPTELGILFDTLGRIGAQTGYPGVAVRLTDDWATARAIDADILALGSLPASLGDHPTVIGLGPDARSQLRLASADAARRTERPGILNAEAVPADREVVVTAQGPLAAVLETQSPFYDDRSIVALLAESPADHRLLNAALSDPAKLAQLRGSVAVIRDSGVTSDNVGERYYVGHLPWTTWLWYHLSSHPWLIAGIAVFAVLLVALLLWRILRRISARRLESEEE